RHDGPAARQLQLGPVLAGLAVRPGKEKDERRIDAGAIGGAHARQRRPARLRYLADHRFESESSARPGDPDYRNGRRGPAGRQGKDRIGFGHKMKAHSYYLLMQVLGTLQEPSARPKALAPSGVAPQPS